MLALFVFQLLVCVTCLSTGFLMHHFVLNIFPKQNQAAFKPIIIYLVSGLITITTVCQWIILFHPMTDTVKIIIGLLLVACIGLKARSCLLLLRHLTSKLLAEPVVLAGISLTWILILVLNSGPTMMDDTESYHIQMVKWIEEWGSVPGLVNLHERYGFNSSWFASISFFNLPGKGLNFYTALNGTMSLWFAGYLLSGTGKIFANDTYRSAGVSIALLIVRSRAISLR